MILLPCLYAFLCSEKYNEQREKNEYQVYFSSAGKGSPSCPPVQKETCKFFYEVHGTQHSQQECVGRSGTESKKVEN